MAGIKIAAISGMGFAFPAKERRHYPRFNIELEVILCFERESFRTKTCNLSPHGMSIQDSLPNHMLDKRLAVLMYGRIRGKSFRIFADAQNVGSHSGPRQLEFLELTQGQVNQILDLISFATAA